MEQPNINLKNHDDGCATTLYGNQKLVVSMKARQGPHEQFAQVAVAHMGAAMNELTYNEFRLYMCLASNAHGYALALSRMAVCGYTGMSSKGYDDAVSGLVRKGYLTPKTDLGDARTKADDRTYYFTTIPMTAVEDPREWMRWCVETNSPGFEFDCADEL